MGDVAKDTTLRGSRLDVVADFGESSLRISVRPSGRDESHRAEVVPV